MNTDAGNHVREHRSRGLTPLGIIATFVALAETVTGVAATQTTGGIQVAFTSFAIVFPLLVATGFFTILWQRNYVLYPPKEFGAQVDVRHYVDAMRQQALGNQQVMSLVRTSIAEAIHSTVARQALGNLDPGSGSPWLPSVLEETSSIIESQALASLERAVVIVDVALLCSSKTVSTIVYPFDASQSAYLFLSAIYFQLRDDIPPFSYGQNWALEESPSRRLLLSSGVDWTMQHAVANSTMTVAEFGIVPGMRLRAVPLRNGSIAVHRALEPS